MMLLKWIQHQKIQIVLRVEMFYKFGSSGNGCLGFCYDSREIRLIWCWNPSTKEYTKHTKHLNRLLGIWISAIHGDHNTRRSLDDVPQYHFGAIFVIGQKLSLKGNHLNDCSEHSKILLASDVAARSSAQSRSLNPQMVSGGIFIIKHGGIFIIKHEEAR